MAKLTFKKGTNPPATDVKALRFKKKVELPKAESWKARRGDCRIFQVVGVFNGQFGQSFVVKDLEDPKAKQQFLPHHVNLIRRLEAAEAKAGSIFRITCTETGSRTPGDSYQYEVEQGE